jgi:hypothetical protein
MGLGTLVRNAIATAHRLTNATDGLQATVTYAPWTGQDSTGAPTYGSSESLPALVEYLSGTGIMRTDSGETVAAKVRVLFLELPTASTATNRQGRIDPRDRLTLPDLTVRPIVAVSGVIDPETGHASACEVFCG